MSRFLSPRTRRLLWPLGICLTLGACASNKHSIFDPPPPPELPVPVETRVALPPVGQAAPAPEATPSRAPAEPAPAIATAPTAEQAIDAAFADWQAAWASRNVPAYLKHYAPGFKGQEKTAEQWQAKRKQIIAAAGKIELACSLPRIELTGEDVAKLTFEQDYRSRSKQDSGIKTLVMRRIDGQWLIEQERFEAAAK